MRRRHGLLVLTIALGLIGVLTACAPQAPLATSPDVEEAPAQAEPATEPDGTEESASPLEAEAQPPTGVPGPGAPGAITPQPGVPPCSDGSTWGRGGMMGGGPAGPAQFPQECAAQGWYGMGGGMMGGWRGRPGPGMMGGGPDQPGGFGPGAGMMGGWLPPADLAPTAGSSLTLDQAVEIADAYIAAWDAAVELEMGEVMQFGNHFYAEAFEVETGRGAFEFLIDPFTGAVYGEPGPNTMWNLRYGTMGQGMGMWQSTADGGEDMTVSPDQAREYAQTYLDQVWPGAQIDEEVEAFYGYYTLHILLDDQIVGMLSVNGYTGQVWLHHWHGQFIDMTEHDE